MLRQEGAERTTAAATTAAMLVLYACVAFGGVAALIYQTTWSRQFATAFGASELAAATILAAWLGGMAIGAWLAGRFLHLVSRPVLAYAGLQIGIAVSAAVAVPALMWVANVTLPAWFGNQPTPPEGDHAGIALFHALSAFVTLVLPATLMGATLPLLARFAVSEESQIGRRIGLLYALHIAGAALGALLASLLLIPELGLAKTIWVAAGFNAFVFLLAIALANKVSPKAAPRGYSLGGEVPVPGSLEPPPPPPAPPPPRRPRMPVWTMRPGAGWVLPLIFLVGAVAFFLGVLWSRMFSHVLGGGINASGVWVASALAGIALGGMVGAAVARTREWAAFAMGIALIVAAAAGGVAYLSLEGLLSSPWSGVLPLAMAVAIGTTYPLAARILARDADDAAPASARVFAWSTAGAIPGVLLAGLVVIPSIGYEGAILVAVLASAALGIIAFWLPVPPVGKPARIAAATVCLLAMAGCAFFRPQPLMQLLVSSPLGAGDRARVIHHAVGRSTSVVVLTRDGGLVLRADGLPLATIDAPGTAPRFDGELWIAPLAVLARPDARDALILGHGGGVVIETVPPSVERVDVIETEPAVVEANRATAQWRKRNPFNDPRVNIVINEPRSALRLTSRQYDVIISSPSHPWTTGASTLLTKEFVTLAHERLTPGGVFVVGMKVHFLDEALLRSLTATLLGPFDELRVYRPDPATVIFLASDSPLPIEQRLADTGLPLRSAPLHYARFSINTVEDLLSALVLDSEGARKLAFGAPLITDDDNRIATSQVLRKQRGMSGDAAGRLFAAHDPMQRADSFVFRRLADALSFPYLARRHGVFVQLDHSQADRLARMSQILGQTADGEYARAYYYRATRQVTRSQELLRLAIDDYPRADALRLEFLRSWVPALANASASPEIAELARELSPLPAAVLTGARHAVTNEWERLARADASLAEVPWTHEWYPEATELRILWRLRVTSPEARRGFADEAIGLLDRLAVLNPTLNYHGLRARAGLAAERPDVAVESISSYATLGRDLLRGGVTAPASLREDARALLQILDTLAKNSQADQARVTAVRAALAPLAAG